LGGASLRAIASKFGFHRDQVWRHMRDHVSPDTKAALLVGATPLAQLREKAAEERGSVLEHLQIGRSMTLNAMVNSAEAASWSNFANLAGRYVELNRTIATISGEIERIPGVSVTNNIAVLANDSKMVALERGLLAVAREVPAARGPIVQLLRDLDAKQPPRDLKEAFAGDAALGLEKPAHGLPSPAGEVIEHEGSDAAA
jgi:hypothetical protein